MTGRASTATRGETLLLTTTTTLVLLVVSWAAFQAYFFGEAAPPTTADAIDAVVGAVLMLIVATIIVVPRRRCRAFVVPVAWQSVGIAAVAGIASNQRAVYDWQYAANQARRIEGPVLARDRGAPLRALTIATDDVPLWHGTLTADDEAPMLEFRLRRPGLPVRVVDRRGLAAATAARDPADLVPDADADFAPVGGLPS